MPNIQEKLIDKGADIILLIIGAAVTLAILGGSIKDLLGVLIGA